MPTPRDDRNSALAEQARGRRRIFAAVARSFVALAALLAIGVALAHLLGERAGLSIRQDHVGPIPVTVFRPRHQGSLPPPVVAIAHGFAGSQQLMQPFAITLARNGMVAVTFDFPGHGRNPVPLPGGLTNDAARTGALLDALGRVVAWAKDLPDTDGRVALLGHSMAVEVLLRYALAHPEVAATVAISGFAPPGMGLAWPRNVLAMSGVLEPPPLRAEAARIAAAGLPGFGAAAPNVTYGAFADGTARRLIFAPGVEHIGVLYSLRAGREALEWLDASLEWHGGGFVDHPGPWLGWLFLGIVALGWPLASLLPRVVARPVGGGLRWARLLPVAILPALATPLVLWRLPTDFLPILLGDYLAAHFAVYGIVTAAAWWLLRDPPQHALPVRWTAMALATAAVAAYCIGALGAPIDAFLTSFVPDAPRWPLIAAVFAGTLPYFLVDEWITRGRNAAPGGYAFTKLCFVLSLALAIGLDVRRLFFLIIIVPVILLFLIVYGLFSTWTNRSTGHPWVAAVANALAFAWAIAVVFPLTHR